jgi:hypothetical protein
MSENAQELIEHVVSIGLVRAPDVEDARLRLKRMADRGEHGSMIEMLVNNGMITHDQLRRFSAGLNKVIPTCFQCLKRSVLDEESFSGTFICQHCQAPVSFRDRSAGLGDELLPNPPARIVDKIVEKLVSKSGITPAKIEALKRDRKKVVPRPTLLEMFLEKNMIKEEAYYQIKGKAEAIYRKRFAQWAKLAQDFELATFLCKMRVVAQATLSEELQKQLELALNNTYRPLRDALVRSGALTEYQLREFLPEQFDKITRRNELLGGLPGARVAGDGEDLQDSEWEDSLVELGDEMEDEDLNVIALDDEAAPQEELNPREAQQRKMFSSFYQNELKDIKSAKDLRKKK